jgi:predicted transcriptional regulator
MQAVLISIKPKWCSKIANGEKTIEVRKKRPSLEAPFKVYIYCTHGSDMLWIMNPEDRKLFPEKPTDVFTAKDAGGLYPGNGKVIGELTCDRIYELETKAKGGSYYVKGENQPTTNDVARQSCLDLKDMHAYLHSQKGYGWHISDFKLYDKPLPLNTFKKWFRECAYSDLGLAIPECEKCTDSGCFVQKPPQSWCFVEEL